MPEQGNHCGFETDHCFEAMRRFESIRVGRSSFTLGQEMCRPRDDSEGRDAQQLSRVAGARKAGFRGAESLQSRVRTHDRVPPTGLQELRGGQPAQTEVVAGQGAQRLGPICRTNRN